MRGVSTRWWALYLVGVLALPACGTAIRFGRLPDFTPLETKLEQGSSTRADVLQALGQPRGHGRVLFPIDRQPREVWYYYYEESTMMDSKRTFLYVFFDGDRFDGYMWFSSLPRAEPVGTAQTLEPG